MYQFSVALNPVFFYNKRNCDKLVVGRELTLNLHF